MQDMQEQGSYIRKFKKTKKKKTRRRDKLPKAAFKSNKPKPY